MEEERVGPSSCKKENHPSQVLYLAFHRQHQYNSGQNNPLQQQISLCEKMECVAILEDVNRRN